MQHVTALLCVLVRLVRASDGVHSDPSGYLRAVFAEVRRRSRRVRRYAANVPTVAVHAVPRVPAPRRPLDSPPPGVLPTFRVPRDYVAVVDPAAVYPPAALVRGHYRAYERERAAEVQNPAA